MSGDAARTDPLPKRQRAAAVQDASRSPWLLRVQAQLLECASPLALSAPVREPEPPEDKVLH